MRAVLIAAAVLLSPGLALAADPSCVWESGQEKDRRARFEAYEADPSSLFRITLSEAEFAAAQTACGLADSHADRDFARNAVMARVAETGAGEYWVRQKGQDWAAETVWMEKLTEEERAALRRWAVSAMPSGNGDEAEFDPFPKFIAALGATQANDPGFIQAMMFVLGRGWREAAEGAGD